MTVKFLKLQNQVYDYDENSNVSNLSALFCLLQTVKGGYSETRIEKRIIITGDDDVDQEQVRRNMDDPIVYSDKSL